MPATNRTRARAVGPVTAYEQFDAAETAPSLPVPSPAAVRAARAHLTARYGSGVQTLLFESYQHPLPDHEAIRKTIAAVHAHDAETARHTTDSGDEREDPPGTASGPDGMDLGAALVVLRAARLDLDRLEAELIGAVRQIGMDWATIASILELPDARTAERRYEKLRPRLDAPFDQVRPPGGAEPDRRRGDGPQ